MIDYTEYTNLVLLRRSKKNFKITNSITTREIYRKLIKLKILSGKYFVTETTFSNIIKEVNLLLLNKLLLGHSVNLPCRLGKLEIVKVLRSAKYKNGKLKVNYPVNWKETLMLWHSDKEAANKKTLVRFTNNEIFRIIYNNRRVKFNNKNFIKFSPLRSVKLKLKEKANNKEIDGHELYHN